MDRAIPDMLARLVSFDTTSRNPNLPLIDFVQQFLFDHGVASLRVDHEEGRKTNLYATIGPDIAGGIVLSGHTDVVPVDGQAWDSDPFAVREADGLLYGRGTADMKGFIAVALAMVPHFAAAGLKRPIHLALSCDEEVGCTGVRPLIRQIVADLPRPELVIVGEPTSMQVVNAHKGGHSFCTTVTGHECHSSNTHHGVNAIEYAGEMMVEVARIRDELRGRGDPSGRFDPPYATVHIGLISGGTARNIVPRECAFEWETRLLPGADRDEVPARIARFAETLEARMHAVSPDTGIATRERNWVPGLRAVETSPAEALALQLTGANAAQAVSYATEAGLFQEAGIPAIVCGPGSIDQAHKPNEFIALSELEKCETFMQALMRHCCR